MGVFVSGPRVAGTARIQSINHELCVKPLLKLYPWAHLGFRITVFRAQSVPKSTIYAPNSVILCPKCARGHMIKTVCYEVQTSFIMYDKGLNKDRF